MGEVVKATIISGTVTIKPNGNTGNNVSEAVAIGGSLAQKAFSPTVELTQTESGVDIAITDVNGRHEASIANGQDYTITQEDYDGIAEETLGRLEYDDAPTDGSDNLLTSGTIKEALDGKADIGDFPTKVSDLTNDLGFITSYTETDPTVPAWAKQATKPSYTAQEVGALPADTQIPSSLSDLDNDMGFYVKPVAGITIEDIAPGVVSDIESKADIEDIPTSLSELTNDAGYITADDIAGKLDSSQKGAANGIAELDENGRVPQSQLPSYVDDVLEFNAESAFPQNGESGKIYIAADTNLTYRWSGSQYVQISSSLALGETSSSAYRGDRGKEAYDHASAKGSAFASGLYKIATNSEGHVTGATAVAKSDITALGIPGSVPTKTSDLTNDSGFLTQHQSISGKADKVSNATSGNFASLDANGNLVDSGHKPSDYLTASDVHDGATFTPSVSEEGVLSWTNDGGKTNPQSINIKGPKGDQGDTGDPGVYVGSETPSDPDVSVWIDPTDSGFEEIEDVVTEWLDDHPEATTTVQDGSITKAKLDSSLRNAIEDVSDLKDSVSSLGRCDDSNADSDLDITDSAGNAIARFAYGHIVTKNFDSSYVSTIQPTADTEDLSITDPSGNAIVRFEGGHIKVKNFDSSVCSRDWRGKKWCCVGDSLTEKNIRSDLVYHDYISARTGINVTNIGHSGAGYYYRGYSYGIRDQVGRVPTDSDVVTIFGSGNDCYGDSAPLGDVTDTGETTVCGCINKALSILYTRFPAVNLGIITPTPWYLKSGTRNWSPLNPGNIMELYCEALVEICKRNSVPCLDLYHMSNLRPYDAGYRALMYSKDEGNGVHPNEQGHFLIAARFQAFLETLLLH